MLLQRLKVSGFLSFGPKGIDLELRPLNVLIGANGSGKSNLLEAITLMKATAAYSVTEASNNQGSARDWLWQGPGSTQEARIETVLAASGGGPPLRHEIVLRERNRELALVGEHVSATTLGGEQQVYASSDGEAALWGLDGKRVGFAPDRFPLGQSIVTRRLDLEQYPALERLERGYRTGIQLYRNWEFGPNAQLRLPVLRDTRGDFLKDGGSNLAAVLSEFPSTVRQELIASLRDLYDGIAGYRVTSRGVLYLEETDGREIPAQRLSDGTVRHLCLLSILLHPEPPALVVIEEPELGLHPDVIHVVAELLRKASKRMQLIVTTHSRQLIDALGEEPEAVVVCEKEDGESQFRRLNGGRMKAWLDRYSLGELWSKGELGGNRW